MVTTDTATEVATRTATKIPSTTQSLKNPLLAIKRLTVMPTVTPTAVIKQLRETLGPVV